MHAFGGELPVEWAEHLAKQDVGDTIRWHQRVPKLLQSPTSGRAFAPIRIISV